MMRLSSLSVVVILTGGLVGCGGGSKAGAGSGGDAATSDASSDAALFTTATLSGTVQLPAGATVALQSLTVQTSLDGQPVSSSGAFSVDAFSPGAQLVIVLSQAGNPMLMGWLDSTHTIIDAESTAEVLLWFGAGAPYLPNDAQTQALTTVGATPGLDAVTQAISASLVSSPDSFATSNPAVTAAMAQVLVPFMQGAPGMPIPFDLAITPGIQSGLSVIQDSPFAAHITNTFRRRAWADVQRVSETTTGSDGKPIVTPVLPGPEEIMNFEVLPVSGLNMGLIGTFSYAIENYITQPLGTPINTAPISLPLTSGSSKTTYQVTIMGPGASMGAAFANLNAAQTLEFKQVVVGGFVLDMLMPIISNVVLGTQSVLGQGKASSGQATPAAEFVASMAKSITKDLISKMPKLITPLANGQYKDALVTPFSNVPGNPSSSTFRTIVENAWKTALMAEYNINTKLETGLMLGDNLFKAFNVFLSNAGIGLEVIDARLWTLAVGDSDWADAWTVTAIPTKVKINPNPARVDVDTGTVYLTALVMSPMGTSTYSYLWSNTGTAGSLSGAGSGNMMPVAGGGVGTSYCSSDSSTLYAENTNNGGAMGMDTVTVSVYATPNCQGMLIGTSAPDVVTVPPSNVTLTVSPPKIVGLGSSTLTTNVKGVQDGGVDGGPPLSYDFSCAVTGCPTGTLEDVEGATGNEVCSNSAEATYQQASLVSAPMTQVGFLVRVYDGPGCAKGGGTLVGSAPGVVTVVNPVTLTAEPSMIDVNGSSDLTASVMAVGGPDAGVDAGASLSYDFSCPTCSAGGLQPVGGGTTTAELCSATNQVTYVPNADVKQTTTDGIRVTVYNAPDCSNGTGMALGQASAPVTVGGDDVQLSPSPASVDAGGTVSIAATIVSTGSDAGAAADAGSMTYSYLWTNSATAGVLSGPGSDTMMPAASGIGTSYCSSSPMTAYTANAIPDGGAAGTDTVTLVVYTSAGCQGTSLGPVSTPVMVTAGQPPSGIILTLPGVGTFSDYGAGVAFSEGALPTGEYPPTVVSFNLDSEPLYTSPPPHHIYDTNVRFVLGWISGVNPYVAGTFPCPGPHFTFDSSPTPTNSSAPSIMCTYFNAGNNNCTITITSPISPPYSMPGQPLTGTLTFGTGSGVNGVAASGDSACPAAATVTATFSIKSNLISNGPSL